MFRLFADKMLGGAVYHIKFVGRLVGMLVNLLARMVSILWGPCQGALRSALAFDDAAARCQALPSDRTGQILPDCLQVGCHIAGLDLLEQSQC